jgi:FdrA protein
MVNTIKEARKISTKEQRQIYFIGFVCGTDMDPQNLTTQIKILKSASVIVAESNAEATRRATSVILTNSTDKKSIAGSSNNA